ncbi:unnamed protein product [Mytilus coruscus]|uniref:Uncharacterized protein n=1 Tax=Mytilus coruscus TaxID=42192 RepID=A0A6J8EZM9_MYTCO|nr:unnamed protein product [Mytilus coruscus]
MAESSVNEVTIVQTNSVNESSTDKDEDNKAYTLSSMQTDNSTSITRRHVSPNSPLENREIMAGDGNDRADNIDEKKPRLERRQIFNLIKYFISIVLAVSDITFDWVEYFEMNKRGNYSIVVQRRSKGFSDTDFTHECQGQGETLQLIFLVFAIVGTALSVLQILNILYQLFYEFKGVDKDKRLVHEFVETFVFLFFVEIQQMFLIMGFYHVCTLDCDVNGPEIFIATNGIISYVRIFWRFFTSFKLCSSHLTTKRRRKVQFATSGDNNCCRIVGIIILLILFPIAIPFVCIICILSGSKKR